MADWTTDALVKEALGLDPADTVDESWIGLCVAAVNQFVDDTRPPTVDAATGREDPPVVVPDGRTQWGATQLATRWYARRNSTDVSAFVELGGPPPSIDRDIEVSLRIGRHFRPVAV